MLGRKVADFALESVADFTLESVADLGWNMQLVIVIECNDIFGFKSRVGRLNNLSDFAREREPNVVGVGP